MLGQVTAVKLGRDADSWTGVVLSRLEDLFTSDIVMGPTFTGEHRQSAKVIVYLPTRKLAAEVAAEVERLAHDGDALAGVRFEHVHGDMEDDQRRQHLDSWREEGLPAVMFGTTCIAAGLDVATVRAVYVCGVHQTLTTMFQSFGRAGRDGQPALACLLLDELSPARAYRASAAAEHLSDNDPYEGPSRREGTRLALAYAEGTECRRQTLHTPLDGRSETCLSQLRNGYQLCDVCDDVLKRASLQRAAPAPLSRTPPLPSPPAALPAAGTKVYIISYCAIPIRGSIQM